MTTRPTAKSIARLLKPALEQTDVVLAADGRPFFVDKENPDPPTSRRKARLEIDRYLDQGDWTTTGSDFQKLQEWVEVHWNTGKEKPAPAGTVATGDDAWVQPEVHLDAVTATKKLIAAASLYGMEQVAVSASHFAAHGMIETHRIWLLKGPPIATAIPLDDYCTLLPYDEALQKIEAESDPGDTPVAWSHLPAGNVCALQESYFERAGPQTPGHRQFASPLLKHRAWRLLLLLGLVWGNGFRAIGNWRNVPAAVAATLPYQLTRGPGTARWPVALPVNDYEPPPRRRPLAVTELHRLAASYSQLPDPTRHRLERAMERLRSHAERIDDEDRVIDLAIALQTLFLADDERESPDTLIPPRAAWFYADSSNERRHTEEILGSFYGLHTETVRGRASKTPSAEGSQRDAGLLPDTENVLRTCLKTMIAEGCPEDWSGAMERSALRLDLPRPDSDIPAVKSDSLSWSVHEQREIDQALEAVWKPIVEDASPAPNMSPATASLPAPELVQRYREQGTPYVVIHPARLYMAHPKWPKTASEPLEDRTIYYCQRDVMRHTWQWKTAAASKGLVQFEAPADAGLYHPKQRADWPQPLLSSHEEDPDVEIAEPRAAAGKTDTPRRSITDAVTEPRQDSAAEGNPAAPSSDLPESTVAGLESAWRRLWENFRHEVIVATDSLFFTLEAIHLKHLEERERLVPATGPEGGDVTALEDSVRTRGDVRPLPSYPMLRAFPVLTGEPLITRTAPGGTMEQIALKAWFSGVYALWEHPYRTQLKHETRYLSGSIRPRQQVLGDLGLIRNDLLHHNAVAQQRFAARCEILQWFSVDERMELRLRHVFDFLNQMGWLTEGPTFLPDRPGTSSAWTIDTTGDPEKPAPALISARPFVNPQGPDPRQHYGAGVAFENGVFGNTPMGPVREETPAQAKERTRKWMKMYVNKAGDLEVPGLGTVSAADLYQGTLKGERHTGPGIPGPWIQFRK